MNAIDPGVRAELGELLHTLPQQEVMSRIPQFGEAVVHAGKAAPPTADGTVSALVFNMERGVNCNAIIEFLKTSPDIQPFDIILANELDDGCTRSGERDVTREIGEALQMHYVFALEFIELKQSAASKGFHGNAVFSRYPIRWARVLRLPEENNWFFDRQCRIGGRCAIFAEIDVNGQSLGVVSIHLENRTSGEGRLRQMNAIYEEALRLFPDMPILLGGDLNTNTFDGREPQEIQALAQDPDELARRTKNPELYEALLPAAETYGFEFRQSACDGVTRRKPLPNGSVLPIRLDWLLSRGLQPIASRIISTQKEDFHFAPAGSVLASMEAAQLSDHNAVWAHYHF